MHFGDSFMSMRREATPFSWPVLKQSCTHICMVCCTGLSGTLSVTQHFRGARHRAEELKCLVAVNKAPAAVVQAAQQKARGATTQRTVCKICKVFVPDPVASASSAVQHVRGRHHLQENAREVARTAVGTSGPRWSGDLRLLLLERQKKFLVMNNKKVKVNPINPKNLQPVIK